MFTGRNTHTTVRQIWHPQTVYLSKSFNSNNYITIIIIITITIICNKYAISKKTLWNTIRFYEHLLTSSALVDIIGTFRQHRHCPITKTFVDINTCENHQHLPTLSAVLQECLCDLTASTAVNGRCFTATSSNQL